MMPRTLRARLGLLVAALALAVGVGVGLATYAVFVNQQDRQLHAALAFELDRAEALLAAPTLGASLEADDDTGFALQLVTASGGVAVRLGPDLALPEIDPPARTVLNGVPYLVGSAPWEAAAGTIRVAIDVSDALAARRTLARVVVLVAALAVVLAALVGVAVTNRALAPLAALADRARALDPADPRPWRHDGPRDEVGDLAVALSEALNGIRERKERERAVLLEVGHELASPLMRIDRHLEVAREAAPDDRRLAAAHRATKEVMHTSRDLLALAHGELERPLDLWVVDVAELARDLADDFEGLSVHADAAVEVAGDPDRLRQVLRNVVRNAVRAAGSAGGVHVSVRDDGATAVLEVRDEGPGMEAAEVARVFERGYTGTRGVGVGLTISRDIIERHDGTIDVASAPGEGTTVTVRIPTLVSRLDDAAGA